jgi:hypothetical protein
VRLHAVQLPAETDVLARLPGEPAEPVPFMPVPAVHVVRRGLLTVPLPEERLLVFELCVILARPPPLVS